MALATQCPHCLTIFRVASDQLKLRGGLVRCGSCRQVFNGNEFLVEPSVADGHYQPVPGSHAQASEPALVDVAVPVTRAAAPITPATSPAPAPRPADSVTPARPQQEQEPAIPAPVRAAIPVIAEPKVFRSPASPGYIPDLGAPLKPAPAPAVPSPDAPPATPVEADPVDSNEHAADLDDGFSLEPLHATEEPAHPEDGVAHEQAEADGDGEDGSESDDKTDSDADEPAFVRRAERRARISHIMKMVMMILAGVMVPVLLLQSLYYWRNPLAVAVPQVRPMLNGMCVALHCTVGLPAEIERLSLEANELQVVPPNQNVYALTVVMRNRGASPQAWPHIELTLNNDDEKAVVRRVFRPRDYLSDPKLADTGIGADSEQQIKLNFELKDALVSGYRIYLFYP
ncbi:DUF3426 domain-containing protein [Herbaspirillum sp. NPDC087042]|uniref:DUF3426 domain-containing protein n=1 Tax=Herbaspirillum sp. NPDC087042 TaxID=3364004 RepID=UPI0037FFD56A